MKCPKCDGESEWGFTCSSCNKFFCNLCSFNQKIKSDTEEAICKNCAGKLPITKNKQPQSPLQPNKIKTYTEEQIRDMTLSQYNEAIQNYEKEMCCLIDTISRVAHANELGDARYNFTAGSQAYTIQSLTHPEGDEELTIHSQNNIDDKSSQIMFLSKGKHIETYIEGEWESTIYLLDINLIKQREKKKKDELVEKARKIGLIRNSN